MEFKEEICDSLCETLRKTRKYSDLVSLVYQEFFENDDEIVTATFTNGSKKVIDVTMDSGYAMIRDIIENL